MHGAWKIGCYLVPKPHTPKVCLVPAELGSEQALCLVSPHLAVHLDLLGISLSLHCASGSHPLVQHATATDTASLPSVSWLQLHQESYSFSGEDGKYDLNLTLDS